MKADVGIHQEQLPSGDIANSWMRYASSMVLIGLALYMISMNSVYNSQLNKYVKLVSDKIISEQTFSALVLELERYDHLIIVILLVAGFAPKAIQKVAELWASNKFGN